MKRLLVLTILVMLVRTCMAEGDLRSDFLSSADRYYYDYSRGGYLWHWDPGAQIVQAMSDGLGKALDATRETDKRNEIIDKWLKVIELSRSDVSKAGQVNLNLREENLKLREAILELRQANYRLRMQIDQLRLEVLKLQREFEKVQAEKLRLEKDSAEQVK